MLCEECSKRSYCSELCPEAEYYVKQDEVVQKEITIGLPIFGVNPWESVTEKGRKRILDRFDKWPRKKQVVTLLNSGLTRKEISQVLGITMENVRNIIGRDYKHVTV